MKVGSEVGKSTSIHDVVIKDDKKNLDNDGITFLNKLKSTENANYDEKLKKLVKNIIEQGEKLSKKVDIRELKIYKKLISELLGETIGSSHKFSKESFIDRRGRYRVYATVKKINKELDNLTQDILKSEKDNLGILKRIEDIRGMILDISL